MAKSSNVFAENKLDKNLYSKLNTLNCWAKTKYEKDLPYYYVFASSFVSLFIRGGNGIVIVAILNLELGSNGGNIKMILIGTDTFSRR